MYTYEEFFEDIARIIAAIIGYSIGLLILLQCWSFARTFLDPWWNLCTSLENWRSQPIPSDDLSLYRPNLCTQPDNEGLSLYLHAHKGL